MNFVTGLDRSVLMVRCAHMWGTGVVVDKRRRIVLTCAHVLAEVTLEEIRPMECANGRANERAF